MDDNTITTLLQQLDDEDRSIRIHAINELANSGDELCLNELRSRLKESNEEHMALIIAVGKLKKALGIK